MTEKLQGKGLFVFSDASGAKSCLALAHILLDNGSLGSCKVFSNKNYAFYKEWNTPVVVKEELSKGDMIGYDFLFTGTSHAESSGGYELKAVDLSNTLNIPSFSFVDHWVNFFPRFVLRKKPIFPTGIFLPDHHALKEALKEGLPGDRLFEMTNPYHRFIKDYWSPQLKHQEIKNILGIKREFSKNILFAPDPVSLRFAPASSYFDETSALVDLIDSISSFKSTLLIVRPHPLQPLSHLARIVHEYASSGAVIMAADMDGLELINFSDLVIGFYSNFLIEADLLGKPVIRYFPASSPPDLLAHLELGNKITGKTALTLLMGSLL